MQFSCIRQSVTSQLCRLVCYALCIINTRAVGAAPFEHHVAISSQEGPAQILHKAANVVPSRAQRLHHQDAFIGFIHFGPNTFSGMEWGSGKEEANIFNPGDTLDTDQWCRILKAAGMTKVVITVKHHDGFCLWQSRYNDTFSVRAVEWRDGKGDVLRELADSCREHGLKLGVYLSPADLYQIESETGLYGNLSEYQTTTIPTAVASFTTDPTKVRVDKPTGAPTFTVEADDYNRYFMNQLYELLTEYGPIHEVWFDGAHPKRKGDQRYIKTDWFSMIRTLAPQAVIFGGPDVRWCGNEGGDTRESEWNVLPVENESVVGVDRPAKELGTDRKLLAQSYEVYGKTYRPNYLYYLVCEVNTSIRAGWFWRNDDEQAVRTPDDVFDIYERAVGGNATFLLNIPPNNEGRFSARDEQCLLEVGNRIRDTYGDNRADGALVRDPSSASPHVAGLTDADLFTYWQAPSASGTLVIEFPEQRTVNRFVIQEAIDSTGQRIKSHALDAWTNQRWEEIALATTVGYKRILRFPAVTTDKFRVRVLDARSQPSIAEIAAYYYAQPPSPVSVTRATTGQITLELVAPDNDFPWNSHSDRFAIPDDSKSAVIHYTLDGTEPTANSAVYSAPLELPTGGHLKTRSIVGGAFGPITERWLGLSSQDWKVHHVSSERDAQHSAEKAFDADASTFWLTPDSAQAADDPHALTIDLGRLVQIAGINYLPRQDERNPNGMIETGQVDVSTDSRSWQTAGNFRFGNLLNDPTRRTFLFDRPQHARYIRILSSSGVHGSTSAGAAEIEVLPQR